MSLIDKMSNFSKTACVGGLALVLQACAPGMVGPNPSLRLEYMTNSRVELPVLSESEGWKHNKDDYMDVLPSLPGKESLMKVYQKENRFINVFSLQENPSEPYMFMVMDLKGALLEMTYFVDNDKNGDFETIAGPEGDFRINYGIYRK